MQETLPVGKKKLFELILRFFGASTRPLAISVAIVYMPGVTKAYFAMVYLSPLLFKLCSLSDLVQYRRLIKSPASFQRISHRYFSVVISRIIFAIIIIFPFSIATETLKIWAAISLFCITDSYLMFSEIRYLLSGDTLRSAIYLVCSRIFQVASLSLTFYFLKDFLFFSASYFWIVLVFVSLVHLRSGYKDYDFKALFRYIRKKNNIFSYLGQLRKASVEIISLVFFISTPTLISFAEPSNEVSKYYVIGFSLCSFVIMVFRVLFFNSRVKYYIGSGVEKNYIVYAWVFVALLMAMALLLGYALSGFFDISLFELVLIVLIFGVFVFIQLVNQVMVFYLSARSVNRNYILVSLLLVSMMSALFFYLQRSAFYLELSVLLPAIFSITVSCIFYRKFKR
ncbi:hypothetical protein BKP64_02465 [Marinobacter salinus]|uniref:Uncharacterized protein n=1 Tax=Marinobacter salinus TaxID=1874317 RepID=A0A1D9GHX7_9GAMM|nr:hypothetical protein [Marinobacter salinus]AOY87134.1 hypothetical protein BKP64_02465 [Marinobacter salinus]